MIDFVVRVRGAVGFLCFSFFLVVGVVIASVFVLLGLVRGF